MASASLFVSCFSDLRISLNIVTSVAARAAANPALKTAPDGVMKAAVCV
jgi:hypothetical protein